MKSIVQWWQNLSRQYRPRRGWRWALVALMSFFLGAAASGIIEKVTLDTLENNIVPWLATQRPIVLANAQLLLVGTVALLLVLGTLASIRLIIVNARTSGQLMRLEAENSEREQRFDAQSRQVGELEMALQEEDKRRRAEIDKMQDELMDIKQISPVRLTSYETLIRFLIAAHAELIFIATELEMERQRVDDFIRSLLLGGFEVFGLDLITRACLLVPDEKDPNYLKIGPAVNIGKDSEYRRFYVGPEVPTTIIYRRGTGGRAYITGEVQLAQNVNEDPDYIPHEGVRPFRPYNSILCAPLTYKDSKLGTLALSAIQPFPDPEFACKIIKFLASPIALAMYYAYCMPLK